MTIQQILAENAKNNSEIEIMLSQAIHQDRSFIYAHPEYQLSINELQQTTAWIEKLRKGQPLSYILHEKEFYGRSFFVDSRVLIPRPETEAIIDRVITITANQKKLCSIAEIGVGSGALIISIALELKKHRRLGSLRGVDISREALAVARMNLRRYHLTGLVKFYLGNLVKPLKKQRFQVIVANLPYLPEREAKLNAFEPNIALNGGTRGDELIQQLKGTVRKNLTEDGTLILENYSGEISQFRAIEIN